MLPAPCSAAPARWSCSAPPIPQGLPPLHRASCPRCPQQTSLLSPQMPSCPQNWLSHAVPKGTGLWYARNSDGQCCSSTRTTDDKERSSQDRPTPPPPAVLDQLPSASTGSVSAQPLPDSWAQTGPARAHARHPDGTGTAKTCQQHPGSTAVFVPLSLIKPVSDEGPSQMPAWPGRAGGEKDRGSYLDGHLWVQREAGAASLWQHPGSSPWLAWAPALPTKCLHRQLVPGSPAPPGPHALQPPSQRSQEAHRPLPMPGERGSRD